jgi:hypothetical protein
MWRRGWRGSKVTKDEKIQAINDMGIDVWNEDEGCPGDHGLKDYCTGNGCEECWILSLEIKP